MMLNRGAPLGEGQGGRLAVGRRWGLVVVALSRLGSAAGSLVVVALLRLGGEFTGGTQHRSMLNRGAPLGEGQGGRLVAVA